MHTKKTEILILGGGLSGLAVDHFLKKNHRNSQTLILEKSNRLGGAIQSFSEAGYQGEWGAHGFLNNSASSQEILADLAPKLSIQTAPLSKFERYICHQGKLECIPQSPKKILLSKLIPWSAKIRVLGDLFQTPLSDEQSVADWASRRFGKTILPFIDAALTGTYAGDMQRLSIDAVMPGLREKELEYKSVIRALLHQRKRKEGARASKGLPAMQSFEGGMIGLIEALSSHREVLFGQEALSVIKTAQGWVVTSQDYQIEAKKLIFALPLPQAIPLLNSIQRSPLPSPAESKIYNVLLGFSPKVKVPYGFGYLAPRKEQRYLLGAMFSSHMFPGRAPEGGTLLECLVGGRLYPERLLESDESILRASLENLKQLIDIPEEPIFAKVLRPEAAIPQPELGHGQFLGWRDQLQEQYPDLKIIGFGWKGIGINDMTKMAKTAAQELSHGSNSQISAEIKGVYF